jgi:hypothetical protein
MTTATVHLLCGLNGAGKTTLARKLEASLPAVRFNLDDWMLRLYPGLHYAPPSSGSAGGPWTKNLVRTPWGTPASGTCRQSSKSLESGKVCRSSGSGN